MALTTIFADNSGNDANAGSLASPKQTISAVSSGLVADAYVFLGPADSWREALSTSLAGVSVNGLNRGAATIDGSDVVTGWTVNGTHANVYEKSVAHGASGTQRLRVYEDGTELTRVADAATCQSTAGSFVDKKGSDGTPWTVQIHPTGSGNPNSNGKTYTVTVREFAVRMKGANSAVSGVIAKCATANDGNIVMGHEALVQRCVTINGSKHGLLVESGKVVDTIALRPSPTTSYESTNTDFVTNTGAGANYEVSYTRCGVASDGVSSTGNFAHYMHDNSLGQYGAFVGEQLWSVNKRAGWHCDAARCSIEGYYSKETYEPLGTFSGNSTVRYWQENYTAGLRDGMTPYLQSGERLLIENSVVADTGSHDSLFRLGTNLNGGTLHFKNCTIYRDSSAAFGGFLMNIGGAWASGTLIIENCIIILDDCNNMIFEVPSAITYIGRNNVFVTRNTSGSNFFKKGSTNYTTLAAWQAATSQDLNSLHYADTVIPNLFLGAVTDGDFRLDPATAEGAAAIALGAGAIKHWDWNARRPVDGAPSRWPDVPDTLADALVYQSNPEGWYF